MGLLAESPWCTAAAPSPGPAVFAEVLARLGPGEDVLRTVCWDNPCRVLQPR